MNGSVCQTGVCLPLVVKCGMIAVKDNNNNNIPSGEDYYTVDNDLARLMCALGLKSKQQQKACEIVPISLIPVALPITMCKRRTRKNVSDEISVATPLCLLNLTKYDVRKPIQYVVTDLKKISVVKDYEEYCVTNSLQISNKKMKEWLKKNLQISIYSSQRQSVSRPNRKQGNGR
ncbi:unnamed protein product [Didymodactylos carnosus]|uniref:Uncharacterized protein n=1 Tax=Didymodactylos carnosus TaxID=1234261 RepID=A0A815XNK4_9BILA|nr:unnamed protein product [Didymodactylos carnosus]CAF1559800.1 unnamed protein product [Didymodactylos carnosus]CAF4087250.1 unnamed protein product [Didymodactylos carnosus]CAF4421168.1 unnamed protein product [Didymodactylos carnosus]